jgi:hypothetical protein
MRKLIHLLLLSFPLIAIGQKAPDCSKIRTGTFYFYPTGSDQSYIINRNDSVQEEIDVKAADTSFYRVEWKNDCEFGLVFIRDSEVLPAEKKDFMATHTVYCEVLKVTKKYYVFKGRLDPDPGVDIPADTLWVRPRTTTPAAH